MPCSLDIVVNIRLSKKSWAGIWDKQTNKVIKLNNTIIEACYIHCNFMLKESVSRWAITFPVSIGAALQWILQIESNGHCCVWVWASCKQIYSSVPPFNWVNDAAQQLLFVKPMYRICMEWSWRILTNNKMVSF